MVVRSLAFHGPDRQEGALRRCQPETIAQLFRHSRNEEDIICRVWTVEARLFAPSHNLLQLKGVVAQQ